MKTNSHEWKLTTVDPPHPPKKKQKKNNEHLDLLCAKLASYLESDLHTDVSDAPAHKNKPVDDEEVLWHHVPKIFS